MKACWSNGVVGIRPDTYRERMAVELLLERLGVDIQDEMDLDDSHDRNLLLEDAKFSRVDEYVLSTLEKDDLEADRLQDLAYCDRHSLSRQDD